MRAGHLPRRAKIQQDQFVVAGQVQVAGFDVPVHESGLVDLPQAVEHGQQQRDRPPPGQRLTLGRFQMPRQVFAFVVVHHQIGGVVQLKEVQHPHQMGMAQLSHRPRFLQKGAPPVMEQVAMLRRVEHHRLAVGRAPDQIARVVFLDRHLHLQGQVEAAIGDPEPALAQFFPDHIALQLRPDWQQRPGTALQAGAVVADWTHPGDVPLARVKTARTGDFDRPRAGFFPWRSHAKRSPSANNMVIRLSRWGDRITQFAGALRSERVFSRQVAANSPYYFSIEYPGDTLKFAQSYRMK